VCTRRAVTGDLSGPGPRVFTSALVEPMKMLKVAAISVALFVNFGAVNAQNMPTPKPEDAERDAFQTPTAGKNVPAPENKNQPHPGATRRAG
jgi:hypothetical protein